jgi:hypothetical protein
VGEVVLVEILGLLLGLLVVDGVCTGCFIIEIVSRILVVLLAALRRLNPALLGREVGLYIPPCPEGILESVGGLCWEGVCALDRV